MFSNNRVLFKITAKARNWGKGLTFFKLLSTCIWNKNVTFKDFGSILVKSLSFEIRHFSQKGGCSDFFAQQAHSIYLYIYVFMCTYIYILWVVCSYPIESALD